MKGIILFLLISLNTISQEVFDEDSVLISLTIVDTSEYKSREIFVFSDRSWEYSDEYNVFEKVQTRLIDGKLKFNEDDLFDKNWKNHKTFSLIHNLKGALDSVCLDVSGAIPPVDVRCNSGFKIRWGKWHQGNDFACSVGTPVRSVWGGKVRYAQMNHGGFGNLVIIRHLNGLETYYAHLSVINVSINETVEPGEIIGRVGNTGHSTGPHLHLEVRFMDNPIDPSTVFDTNTLLVHSGIFKSMKSTNKEVSLKELFGLNMETEETVEQFLQKKRRTRRRTSSNMN